MEVIIKNGDDYLKVNDTFPKEEIDFEHDLDDTIEIDKNDIVESMNDYE